MIDSYRVICKLRCPSFHFYYGTMARVKKIGDEPIEKMLRRFRRECNIDGIKDDYKKSLFYEKPSIKANRKKQEGINNTRRRERQRDAVI